MMEGQADVATAPVSKTARAPRGALGVRLPLPSLEVSRKESGWTRSASANRVRPRGVGGSSPSPSAIDRGRSSTAECRYDKPVMRVRFPPISRRNRGCSSVAECWLGRPATRVRLPPAPRETSFILLALGTSGDVGSLSMSIQEGSIPFRAAAPQSGSSSNGRTLLSHSRNGGSNPPGSTSLTSRVRGRTARHTAATRSTPVRLRADALSRDQLIWR